MIQFRPAVKYDAKCRVALCGPAGSGKTFTGLKLAKRLANGGKVACIDTEHGSMSKYAHTDKCGGEGACKDESHFQFDVIEPETYDPRDLADTIDAAVAQGYKVFFGDSLSHYWIGKGGELEMVDIAAAKAKGNSFAGWKTVTPFHTALIDKLTSAKIHIICGIRTKTEWVVEKDERTGKSAPRKIGMAPIMKDGIEFEFDISGDLDQDNTLTITKSRCSALNGKVINRPGDAMADAIIEWCAGAPVVERVAPQVQPQTISGPQVVPTQAEKPWTTLRGMIECFAAMKDCMSEAHYVQSLEMYGVKDAKDFKDPLKAVECYKAMREWIERKEVA